MFFGLTNSPPTFQSAMDAIFVQELGEGWLVIYMDDTFVFSNEIGLHRQHVRRVLQRFRENDLFLRIEKCEFERLEIEYLGLIISENTVRMDPVKTNAVVNWPIPTKLKPLQSFIGFTNFYRRFITDYSEIALPLHKLTRKIPWVWTNEQQNAFERLKAAIASNAVLAIPNDNGLFKVECDASYYALGAVLSQEQIDRTWRPIAFISHALTSAQRNYHTYDKEFLAIIFALEEWRQYLRGNPKQFQIWSDHRNLLYFKKPQDLNRQQADWVSKLQEYNFKLYHRPGRLHGKADFLSRHPNFDKGDKDNQNVIALPEDLFVSDNTAISVIRIAEHGPHVEYQVQMLLKEREATIDDNGIIRYKGKIYAQTVPGHRERIIQENHDAPLAGHPGEDKTIELVQQHFWWPSLKKDVREYVKGCLACQAYKPHRYKTKAPLNPLPITPTPFQNISMDLIGPLPESKGYDAIFIIVDRYLKRVMFIPTNMTISSEGFARLFRDNWFKLFGLPQSNTSDRDSRFLSSFVTDLYRVLGIKRTPSTAYHPQTDGQTERVNQEIEIYLRFYINHRQDDWAEWLSVGEFAYNDHVHSSTNHSPNFLTFRFHPWKGVPMTNVDVHNQSGFEFATTMLAARKDATDALIIANDTMKKYHDRKKGASWHFQEGDSVWLEGFNILTNRPTNKLEQKCYGPFTIVTKIGPSTYKLVLPASWSCLHPVFNEALLTPYTPPTFPSQEKPLPPPPEIIVDGQVEYSVDFIKDLKYIRRKPYYLVHWTDTLREDDTWEPLSNLTHCPEAIALFHSSHPNVPSPGTQAIPLLHRKPRCSLRGR